MSELEQTKTAELTIRLFQDGNQFFERRFDKDEVTVGREAGVDLIIEDRSISRKHLQIQLEQGRVFVSDMGSSNGTYVDNERIIVKTRVVNETHIRIGKIIIQIITPEVAVKPAKVSTAVTAGDVRSEIPERNEEPGHELTLSRIAFKVEAALSKAEAENSDIFSPDNFSAMIDRNFIEQMTRQHESSTKFPAKKIESLVLWNEQIYNIQEFGYRETINVGPTFDDSIHIPSLAFRWSLSKYDFQEAVFQIPKNMNVFAIRGKNFLSKDQLLKEKRLTENKNSLQIQISFYDVLRVEIDAKTQLYFRYVPSATNLDKKKLFNPDALVKFAILTSFVLHFLLATMMMMIPKEKLHPIVKKAPDRIAKLIVEEKPVPPPVIPPPEEKKPEPPPPEVKKPEPPPPVVKKPDPPKPKPKPKIVKKPDPPPVKKILPVKQPPPKPVQKAEQVAQKPVVPVPQKPAGNPIADNKPAGPKATPVVEKPAPPPPPPPKPVDISKLGALAAMGGLKLDAKSNKPVPANVNIAANTNTHTTSEIGTTSITNDLKNQTAGAAASNSTNSGGPIKTKTKVGGSGYGTEGLGTGTGQRGVKGGVVGKPMLSSVNASGRTEGLSRDQVLKALQAYLGKIQSCYERSLLSDPNLSGRIEFEWNISKSGTVGNIDIKKNSVAGGEQLGDCVSGVIKSIKFPSASNGEETNPSVGFPFGRL